MAPLGAPVGPSSCGEPLGPRIMAPQRALTGAVSVTKPRRPGVGPRAAELLKSGPPMAVAYTLSPLAAAMGPHAKEVSLQLGPLLQLRSAIGAGPIPPLAAASKAPSLARHPSLRPSKARVRVPLRKPRQGISRSPSRRLRPPAAARVGTRKIAPAIVPERPTKADDA